MENDSTLNNNVTVDNSENNKVSEENRDNIKALDLKFEDRTGELDKKTIEILQRNNNQILANIKPYESSITKEGTLLNADIFNNLQNKINELCKSFNDLLVSGGDKAGIHPPEGQSEFNKNILTNNEGNLCMRDYVLIGEDIKIYKSVDGSVVIGFATKDENGNVTGNEEILKVNKVGDKYSITADSKQIEINGIIFNPGKTISSEVTFTSIVKVPDVTI